MGLSRESIALRKSYKAFKGVAHLDTVIPVLYSASLLTSEEKKKAKQRTLTGDERGDEVFDCLERRVSAGPSVFKKLVEVLLTEPALKGVGKKMQACYEELPAQANNDNLPPSPSLPPPLSMPTRRSAPSQLAPSPQPEWGMPPSPPLPPPPELSAESNQPPDLPFTHGTATAQPGLRRIKKVACDTSQPQKRVKHDETFNISNGVSSELLGVDDLFDVKSELTPVSAGWRSIGSALRLKVDVLARIEAANPRNPGECLSEAIVEWLKQNYNVERFGRPSWKWLVEVVAHRAGGNNTALAINIARKHQAEPSGQTTTTETSGQTTPSTTSGSGTLSTQLLPRTTYARAGMASRTPAYEQRLTLPTLIHFRTSSGTMNIVEQIGTKYYDLGILLLEDDTGTIIDAIAREHHYNELEINRSILQRWLMGEGRTPVSWATLIEVLRDMGLSELAHKIEHDL